jgi:prepilin-type N-terminal cleavage/methylation domain-containing protein
MKSKIKGITLIEILLVLGLLAILASFAVPSVSGAVSKAEMKTTMENIRYSLEVARRTARMTEIEVSMHISPVDQGSAQVITFSSPGKGGASNHLQIQDFTLPPDVVLVSDQDLFLFDKRGLVEEPGHILLVSRLDESLTSTINID